MCGIVGIYGHQEAANLVYLCLYALQHRGQESSGIAVSNGKIIRHHKDMGLVADTFDRERLHKLSGNIAVGHVRYSTAGNSELKNAQPFVIGYKNGNIAVVHNGNLTNALNLRVRLEEAGSIFQSTMDSEVIMHLIATSNKPSLVERVIDSLKQVEGAYSLVFLNGDQMIVARDPNGFRPLVLGELGSAIVAVSETSALDLIDAKYVRSVEPGEVLFIDKDGLKSYHPFERPEKLSHCIFEYIYFSRPDSMVYDRSVYEMRMGLGRQLAKEQKIDVDMVVPVPDSGVPAAIGYAEESGIPFQMGLIRNHYVGRTFIEPENSIRHFGVKIKLNPVYKMLEGKKIVVIDDSIVRGITSKKIVHMLRKVGVREVHFRISSPPTRWPCFYGIDTPTREELIASKKTTEEIREYINADSLEYLSVDGLYWFAKDKKKEWYCDACFTGKYPTHLLDAAHIEELARRL